MKFKFKFKFNTISPLFYSIIMQLDISNEINKLNAIVNNKKILLFENYSNGYLCSDSSDKIKYLLYVLELTYDHPEIEIYLKQLLKNYDIVELNNLGNDYTILHFMMLQLRNISSNSFEIIINLGINVNSQTKYHDTALHIMCDVLISTNLLLSRGQKIINLLVEYGADLNILNGNDMTVFDEFLAESYCELDEHTKNIIITLIDLGAKTNNPDEMEIELLEFIESYRSSNIKPAIKNEI